MVTEFTTAHTVWVCPFGKLTLVEDPPHAVYVNVTAPNPEGPVNI